MKVAIMQPYFLPYIGYFQLIAAVDIFIVYDNIKYTKKGYINRNYMLKNGARAVFTLPLKRDSDHLHVCERQLSVDFNRAKLLAQFEKSYKHAPHFDATIELLKGIIFYESFDLFKYLHHSIVSVCHYLGIETEIKISSAIAIDHDLKSQDKVLALCDAVGAKTYINAAGGAALYSRPVFESRGFELGFLHARAPEYSQLAKEFIPLLSIADVLMFNSPEIVKDWVNKRCELICN